MAQERPDHAVAAMAKMRWRGSAWPAADRVPYVDSFGHWAASGGRVGGCAADFVGGVRESVAMTRVNSVPGSGVPLPADSVGLGHLLHVQHQVLNRRQAMRHLSAKAVWYRVKSGRWQVAHTGVYVAHSGPVTRKQRLWIAVLAAGRGGPAVLGGVSALELLGLRGQPPPRIHVVIPAGRHHRDPPPEVVVHRTRTLSPADIHRVGRPPCTIPARSVIDAARWAATDDHARAIVAAAFQQRLVSRADVEETLSRLRRVRRRELIVVTVADAVVAAGSHPSRRVPSGAVAAAGGQTPLCGRAPAAISGPERVARRGRADRRARPGPNGPGRSGRRGAGGEAW
jgi:hypothetical protein